MQKQISPKIVALTFGILVISFLAAFYVIAWQEPAQTPPGGNVATPLNTGSTGQSKAGGLILNTGGATSGLIVDKGESQFPSVTIIGGTSLPTCNSSFRGKQYLLQGGSGVEDGLYVCKKKADNTYLWVPLASPSIIWGHRHSDGQWVALEELDKVVVNGGETEYWGVNGNKYALEFLRFQLNQWHEGGSKIVLKNGGRLGDNFIEVYPTVCALGVDDLGNAVCGSEYPIDWRGEYNAPARYCDYCQNRNMVKWGANPNSIYNGTIGIINTSCQGTFADGGIYKQWYPVQTIICADDWYDDLKAE